MWSESGPPRADVVISHTDARHRRHSAMTLSDDLNDIMRQSIHQPAFRVGLSRRCLFAMSLSRTCSVAIKRVLLYVEGKNQGRR